MLKLLLITCRFVFEVVQKLYSAQWNFKKLYYIAKIAIQGFRVWNNNDFFVRVYSDALYIKVLQILLITCRFVFEVVQKLYNAH